MDAAFTVSRYSVQHGSDKRRAVSITLADGDDVWRARVEFSDDPADLEQHHVEMCDEHCGRVLMAADYLESFVDLLRSAVPVYVSFSTDADLFLVTARDAADEKAA